MHATYRNRLSLFFAFSLALTLQGVAQQVIKTVPAGSYPIALAVNSVTNKAYVANACGSDPNCSSYYGTVTIIDGTTLSGPTVAVGIAPNAVAVNSVTNKIYVTNICGIDPTCGTFNETVTVIDGNTLSTSTLNAGFDAGYFFLPNALAVNPVTNMIYVIAPCGNDPTCHSNGTVTVIDGESDLVSATVTVGSAPQAVAVNRMTNTIYVANLGSNTVTVIDGMNNSVIGSLPTGISPNSLAINEVTNQVYVANGCVNEECNNYAGTVTVIDAAHNNNTTTFPVGSSPLAVAVNPVSNLTYVANACGVDPTCNSDSGTVTVIDGQNNSIPVNVGKYPLAVAVDGVTNKIYVGNAGDNTVTVIDGATNTTVTVPVGSQSTITFGMAVNSVANRIYVSNTYDGTVSVIAGAKPTALQFVPIAPCRVVDTRNANSQFGGPAITGGTYRSFPLPQSGTCVIPSTAAAYSLNVTVVPRRRLGFLTIWPTGEDQPNVSLMNSLGGRIKANAAIVPAGYQGAVSVYVTDTTDVVLDIDGYFAPVSGSTQAFYPVMPCRVLDSRNGQFLIGTQVYAYPVSGLCNVPSTAKAYSLNFTAIPINGAPVGYLTVWPAGQTQPLVSTLNDPTGTIVANAAIVPAGTNGDIDVYASNDTNLVADITGYFAAAGIGGMSLYPAAPCRAMDTRQAGGAFSGELNPPIDVVDSSCGVPNTAVGYVFNVTAVPQGYLGFLTLWPGGQNRPLASTLNALDGAITSNLAILQNFDGESNAYASSLTQLIIDISSYFAP